MSFAAHMMNENGYKYVFISYNNIILVIYKFGTAFQNAAFN